MPLTAKQIRLIDERVRLGSIALEQHADACGYAGPYVAQLLVDIRHWCDCFGVRFDDQLLYANETYISGPKKEEVSDHD